MAVSSKVKSMNQRHENHLNTKKDEEESNKEVFEACIFNCSYAEQQLEDEQEGNKLNRKMKVNDENQQLDVVVSDSVSEDGTCSMDDKSLLDYDSSNSWESKRSS